MYHGVAVNVFDDPAAFAGIRPCGFAREIMTNAERELGRALTPEACQRAFATAFATIFGSERAEFSSPDNPISV